MSIPSPVLVTGATGFIGRRVVERLLSGATAVRALVLPNETTHGVWTRDVEVVRGDITDPESLEKALHGVGSIIHLAAVVSDWGGRDRHKRVTVTGTANVLRGAPADARIVLTSSVVVYGDAINRDVCDEAHPFGRHQGMYSRSKQEQEELAIAIAKERRLHLTVVRPTNVWGPGSINWVDTVVELLGTGLPTLAGNGAGNAGLVYVDNLAELLVMAIGSETARGRIYNGADGCTITWKQYFTDLARLAGKPAPKLMPRLVARTLAVLCEVAWTILPLKGRPPITREALNLTASNHRVPITRAKEELGYEPIVSYEEGLEKVRKYLEKSG